MLVAAMIQKLCLNNLPMLANQAKAHKVKNGRRWKRKSRKIIIVSAQTKQKKYCDKKHATGEVFNVGPLVLRKDFTRRKHAGGKMDYLWTGPYKITGTLGKGLYKLKAVQGGKVKCECVK